MQWKANETADNKGSSSKLSNYLDKEKGLDEEQKFYNGSEQGITKDQVTAEIDKNGKGQLGKKDWKFTHMSYNLSEKESRHLVKKVTGKDATSWKELNNAEKKEVNQAFTKYVTAVQTEQAKNYNRANIQSEKDLKWYARNETERRYKGFDEEVKQGKAKSGQKKAGFNLHAHVIQSRKGADKKTKLSPYSTHRVNKKSGIKQGFDRKEFIKKQEQTFDKMFDYKRDLEQKFEYKNAVKKNDLQKIESLKVKENKLNKSNKMDKEKSQKQQPQSRDLSEEIGKAKAEMTDAQKRFLQKEKELEHKREQEQNQRKGMRR